MCLQCIKKQTYRNRETVVINDGSTDGTSRMLKGEFPQATVLRGDGNLWWTGAMRMGIAYIQSEAHEGDFVLLMNDDTIFEPEYLEAIVRASQENNRAIIGSISFDAEDHSHVEEAGVKMNWVRGRVDVPLRLPKNYKKRKVREVDTFCGRGTLVPIEVFQKIGTYTDKLPHYLSDYEFFIRAKKAGFRLLISYEAVTYATREGGGIKFIPKRHISLGQFLNIVFSRRSKSNVIDKIIFILLAAPPQEKAPNLTRVGKSLIWQFSYVYPLSHASGFLVFFANANKFLRGIVWCVKRRLKGLPC